MVERCCLRRRWHCIAPRRSKATPWGPRGRGGGTWEAASYIIHSEFPTATFDDQGVENGGRHIPFYPHGFFDDIFLAVPYFCGLCLPFDQITGGNIRVEDFLGTLSLHFALTQPRATTPATDFVPQLLDDARRVMGSYPQMTEGF